MGIGLHAVKIPALVVVAAGSLAQVSSRLKSIKVKEVEGWALNSA